jgi:hypothetical protein
LEDTVKSIFHGSENFSHQSKDLRLVHSGVIVSIIAIFTPLMVPYFKPDKQLLKDISFPIEHSYQSARGSKINQYRIFLKAVNKFKAPILKSRKKARDYFF